MKELTLFALKNLKQQGPRTYLTILGIIIGIAAIVTFISLGDALQKSVASEFEKIGSDKIIIIPGSPYTPGFSGGSFSNEKFGTKEINRVESLSCVEGVIPYYTTIVEVSYGGEKNSLILYAYPTTGNTLKKLRASNALEIDKGRDLRSSDRYVVVLGHDVAYNVFRKDIEVRNKIKLNGKDFRVVGILKKVGGPDDVGLTIPLKVADEFGFNKNNYNFLFVDVKNDCDVDATREKIIDELKRVRGKEDFKVETSANLLSLFNTIITIIKYIFIGISAISLFVGGIGIMNTMLMSVIERTKEIGILKAIGASNKKVMAIFLAEASAISLAGGLVGILLGLLIEAVIVFAINLYSQVLHFPFVVPIKGLIVAILFAIVVGVISGLYPAWKAARLDPVDALRYE